MSNNGVLNNGDGDDRQKPLSNNEISACSFNFDLYTYFNVLLPLTLQTHFLTGEKKTQRFKNTKSINSKICKPISW